MPQLDPTFFASQLFWLAVTFVLLYALISKLLLPPLLSMMEQRKTTIDGDITESESLKQQAEAAKENYEQALAEARLASKQTIDKAVAEHQAQAEQSMQQLQENIATKLEAAQQQIATKREAMLKELSGSSKELATMITKQLTGTR